MVQMTQSFETWLFEYHRDIFGLVLLGHTELITEEMSKEYMEWCQTDEGKQSRRSGFVFWERR